MYIHNVVSKVAPIIDSVIGIGLMFVISVSIKIVNLLNPTTPYDHDHTLLVLVLHLNFLLLLSCATPVT